MSTFRSTYEAQQAAEALLLSIDAKHIYAGNEGLQICFQYAPRREAEIQAAADLLRPVFGRLTTKVIRRKNGRWTEINIGLLRDSQNGRVLSVTH